MPYRHIPVFLMPATNCSKRPTLREIDCNALGIIDLDVYDYSGVAVRKRVRGVCVTAYVGGERVGLGKL